MKSKYYVANKLNGVKKEKNNRPTPNCKSFFVRQYKTTDSRFNSSSRSLYLWGTISMGLFF